MNTAKIYKEYTTSSAIDADLMAQYPNNETALKALGEYINMENLHDAGFVTAFMKALGYEGDDSALAIKFLGECSDASCAKVFAEDAILRENIINNYCSVMANFIVFSTAQRKNLKDTASYNRHIDKALPEMRDSLMILFELGANEGEYLNSLDKYFEFTYYVNTPDSWALFNSLYAYESFNKYVHSIEEKFLGIYLRSNLFPQSVVKFVSEGNGSFTDAFITALSELASENISSARKTYDIKISVENNEDFVEGIINLYDGQAYKTAIASFRANGGKFHEKALLEAKKFYEYEESPRAKDFF